MDFNLKKKKTYTKYWNNFSEKPKKFILHRNYFKKIKFYLFKLLGFKVSIRIRKNSTQKDEAYISYPIEHFVKNQRNKLLIEELYDFLKTTGLKYNVSELEKYLNEFDIIFARSPVKEHESGFGYNEALFFFVILKIIKPELVIESGVMKGFTTYLIDAATDENCEIFSYDINFENKVFNSPKATYINSDISNKMPLIKNKKTVALWDDHTSQLDRLKLSQEKNIEYNFFDDDLSFLNIHSDGWPPIPTISMLKDIKKYNIVSNEISWISRKRKGKAYINSFNSSKNFKFIENIKFHRTFPQLFPITGYKNHSQCSLVINKILS